jgi:subtilisin family serine protease
MSYYIDPWLFNCTNLPSDSPEDQLEQKTIIQATQRALTYAHRHGVALVAAAGNEFADYKEPFNDESSPDFADQPGEAPYQRTIPPSCLSMPGEGEHVIPVSSTGKSTTKSFFSSHGQGYVAVAAPGGASNETPDNKPDPTMAQLAAYPEAIARASGELNEDGTPNTPRVVRDCKGDSCAYYQYIQGTSMASPHAAGVAALIVSEYGKRDAKNGGLTLDPRVTESYLRSTATAKACPDPRTHTYVYYARAADGTLVRQESEQTCKGPKRDNSWYGNGIIDALNAVR